MEKTMTDSAAREIVECELCGSLCRVVGRTTKHYEPVKDLVEMPRVEELAEVLSKVEREDGGLVGLGMHFKIAEAIVNFLKGESR